MSKHIKLVGSVDVEPLRQALLANPQLWDENTSRTENADSPHYQLSDIWARYAHPDVDASQPHDSVWYPSADLLGIRQYVYPLMAMFQGDVLGGVLITRIKPGQICKPHTDPGWHARYYTKFAIQVQANEQQAFCFEDGKLVTKPGDVFWFDNHYTHWVTNESQEDRITVIVCIRCNQTYEV
jgi:quercetin dioxygenase-like cupin family protein